MINSCFLCLPMVEIMTDVILLYPRTVTNLFYVWEKNIWNVSNYFNEQEYEVITTHRHQSNKWELFPPYLCLGHILKLNNKRTSFTETILKPLSNYVWITVITYKNRNIIWMSSLATFPQNLPGRWRIIHNWCLYHASKTHYRKINIAILE